MLRPKRKAGGIVLRRGQHGPEVLLVTARRNRKRWVFPKGTIEKGETPAETAAREVQEESGVVARVLGPAGTVAYATRTGRVRIEYFLMREVRRTDEREEDRSVRWFAIEDAMVRLSFASTRRMLLDAHPEIMRCMGARR